jgi:radical SAM superfamily enzyme YgiQ (UPF0313 family)
LVRTLLISTYDLGRQPFGLASPAAWLRDAGVDVACIDTSRSNVDDAALADADVIAFYLPMHTATRLAEPLLARARGINPAARLVAYGLYAPLNAAWLRARGVAHVLGPECEQDLVDLVTTGSPAPKADDARGIARLRFIQPDRSTLPALSQYASLHMADGSQRVVGNTDATRGCKHLCRHCPIVPVYRGAFRVVPLDVVMADIRQQVAAGAQHISFGDPDFFNGPTHARRIVEQLAAEFPGLTYDVTIKIEHLLSQAALLPVLACTGCLFVTSAVESVDDAVLARLQKGHTREDFERAVASCRAAGLTLSPTFVAFTPWTTMAGYLELLRAIASLDLIEDVAPIQLAIRLLVTAESALLELPDVRERIGAFDARSLTYPWRHDDPAVDALQQDVMALVASGAHPTRRHAFEAIWQLAHARAGLPAVPLPEGEARRVAHISEPWYCCAEPAEFHL